MSAEMPRAPGRLVDRVPTLDGAEIVAHLVPSRQFATATLDSYRPDRDYPSQGAAVAAVRNFVAGFGGTSVGLFARRKAASLAPSSASTDPGSAPPPELSSDEEELAA